MRVSRHLAAAVATLVVTAAGAVEARGQPRVHRLVRVFDWVSGFPWSYVVGFEQDRHGFLWLTTTSGTFRFDGRRARRLDDRLFVAPGGTQAGRVLAFDRTGSVFELGPDGAVRLDTGPRQPEARSLSFAVATDGVAWRVRDGVLSRLRRDGRWAPVAVPLGGRAGTARVHPGRSGRAHLTFGPELWTIEPDGSARHVTTVQGALAVRERADGTLLVGANQRPGPVTTRIFEVAGGRARQVYEEHGARLLAIAERGSTVWVSTDVALQSLDPGYAPRDRLATPVIPGGGHLVVDREGSLWLGSGRGLVQIPEPDVAAFLPAGGGYTRDLMRAGGGVWGTFWGRLAFLSDAPGPGRWTEHAEPHFSRLCRDGAGRVWTGFRGGRLVELGADGEVGAAAGEPFDPHGCGEGAGARRWIVSGRRDLWTVYPGDERPHRVPVGLDVDGLSCAAGTADGTLWLASGGTICAAPSSGVLAGVRVAWSCEAISGAADVIGLQPMPSGDLWALTFAPGSVRRRAGGRWEVVPGWERLGVDWPQTISRSPSGGVWLGGMGLLVRVAERPDLADGWEILERPTAWNGLTTINVIALHEDADGTLWLGTDVGIQRIPPEIRRRRADPPPVELVEGSASGSRVGPGESVELPYRRNRLDTLFAALSYRDPAAVRYRMRLRDEDTWSEPRADGQFTFVDLPPGRYDLQVAASLDGLRWSVPAHLAFRVLEPWYVEPWLIGSMMLGVVLASHLGVRVRARRRLAQERQRTRIAMDLHDEVGSGLGTIAVLAGIAARPELPQERRSEVVARISSVSQELARSLGDIVWSLRISSGSLDALWNQLLERARPLFSSGRPRLEIEAPEAVPPLALPLVVRRNLHLVAYEALHNAARHSGASVVVLRLAPERTGWRLEIEDDGRGLAEAAPPPAIRRGLGLEAMKTRVAEMGGTIAWHSGPLGGTRVTVRFRTGRAHRMVV